MRERGLKYKRWVSAPADTRRSREGAWIEMSIPSAATVTYSVAPVRERGLKYLHRSNLLER